MAKFVRSSKYRHVFAAAPRKETVWDGVKLTKNAWDSNFVSVNSQYIGISWQVGGGGAVAVIPNVINTTTTANPKLDKVNLVTGHKGAIVDLEFNPFNDNILATVSEDCYGKIWQIPSGDFGNLDKESQLLKGHQRKIGYVSWNPVAENVIATAGTDCTIKIWDVTTGDEKFNYTGGHAGIVNSINWNYDGSSMCSFSKDKKLRIFDPRTSEPAAEVIAHQGVKGGRALWMGKHDKIYSVGFGATSERQYFVWDPKNLSAPLIGPVNIDNSAGVLMPFYDEDSDLIFLAGKGDGSIKYFEVDLATAPEKPEIFYISAYPSNDPTSAIGMLPKRACDVNTNEIVRLYRVQGTKLEPLSFKVPRKSDLFQGDLFPDCRSDEPSLTAEQWFAGENAKPKTKSLQGGFVKREISETNFQKKEDTEEVFDEAALKKENAELKKKVAHLEAELAKLQAQLN